MPIYFILYLPPVSLLPDSCKTHSKEKEEKQEKAGNPKTESLIPLSDYCFLYYY